MKIEGYFGAIVWNILAVFENGGFVCVDEFWEFGKPLRSKCESQRGDNQGREDDEVAGSRWVSIQRGNSVVEESLCSLTPGVEEIHVWETERMKWLYHIIIGFFLFFSFLLFFFCKKKNYVVKL